MTHHTHLHETLRQRLIATGASQAEIGKATALAQSTIGRFLNGRHDISLSNYVRLCAFCDERESREEHSTIEATTEKSI